MGGTAWLDSEDCHAGVNLKEETCEIYIDQDPGVLPVIVGNKYGNPADNEVN